MNNLNIQGRKSLKSLSKYYGEQEGGCLWKRLTVPYTPKQGSWLNQAEIEIGLFARQCLGKRRIPDLALLKRESRAWNQPMNRARVKINWEFSRKAARRKFGSKPNSLKRSYNQFNSARESLPVASG